VKLNIAAEIEKRIGRKNLDVDTVRVAHASGTLAYLPKAKRADYFNSVLAELTSMTPDWTAWDKHGKPLRNLQEAGGLRYIPSNIRSKIVYWMVRAYIGIRADTALGGIDGCFSAIQPPL